jgi:hypothetical protein
MRSPGNRTGRHLRIPCVPCGPSKAVTVCGTWARAFSLSQAKDLIYRATHAMHDGLSLSAGL